MLTLWTALEALSTVMPALAVGYTICTSLANRLKASKMRAA
jgi:hypothetical protein